MGGGAWQKINLKMFDVIMADKAVNCSTRIKHAELAMRNESNFVLMCFNGRSWEPQPGGRAWDDQQGETEPEKQLPHRRKDFKSFYD